MKYETGKDMTTAKDRLRKGKTNFSSNNILGKMSNDKLSASKLKALDKMKNK